VRKSKRQELDQLVNGPLALVAQEKVFVAVLDFIVASTIALARKDLSRFTQGTWLARAARRSRSRGREAAAGADVRQASLRFVLPIGFD